MDNLKEVKSSLHVSIPSKMLELLNISSENLGKSRNQIIEELLEEFLENQRDIKIAEAALKEIADGSDSIVSWSEMKEKLGW
ncbi:MAG: ribbon-helix-helix protein, CopG family [Alphaproteobacteria bacterium]|jgi:predicted DNA-binding protein|nr:ribbon-helix-helix protein, CopG family [Alphaproteobacteria bacterium]